MVILKWQSEATGHGRISWGEGNSISLRKTQKGATQRHRAKLIHTFSHTRTHSLTHTHSDVSRDLRSNVLLSAERVSQCWSCLLLVSRPISAQQLLLHIHKLYIHKDQPTTTAKTWCLSKTHGRTSIHSHTHSVWKADTNRWAVSSVSSLPAAIRDEASETRGGGGKRKVCQLCVCVLAQRMPCVCGGRPWRVASRTWAELPSKTGAWRLPVLRRGRREQAETKLWLGVYRIPWGGNGRRNLLRTVQRIASYNHVQIIKTEPIFSKHNAVRMKNTP